MLTRCVDPLTMLLQQDTGLQIANLAFSEIRARVDGDLKERSEIRAEKERSEIRAEQERARYLDFAAEQLNAGRTSNEPPLQILSQQLTEERQDMRNLLVAHREERVGTDAANLAHIDQITKGYREEKLLSPHVGCA